MFDMENDNLQENKNSEIPLNLKFENEETRKSFDELLKMMRHYETLLSSMQGEIDTFREDQNILKIKYAEILKENETLSTSKAEEGSKSLEVFKKSYVMVADQIINNLKKRLVLCNQEKDTFQSLWKSSQEAVTALEFEVNKYRNELNQKQPTILSTINNLKQEYTAELKKLEENTQHLENQVEKQKKENQKTVDNVKELTAENEDLRSKIKELEDKLKHSNQLAINLETKNTETMKKLEESIEIAEKSMQEINQLMYEKEQIEDEYNNLAETVGSVLEETAKKVDKEMDLQNAKHQEQIAKLEQEILKYQKLLETESKKIQEANCKNEALSKTNTFLDHDLKVAFNIVEDAETKFKNLEKAVELEQKNSKMCEEHAENLRFIIQKKNQYKAVYHELLLKILGLMEKLVAENKKLKQENKSKLTR